MFGEEGGWRKMERKIKEVDEMLCLFTQAGVLIHDLRGRNELRVGGGVRLIR